MTTYRIGDIRPNPFRNIDRYPINREKVEKLKESIGRTDFWDNLVARIGAEGKPEIGYGHHRMVALRELYDDDHEISLIVRALDDAAMLHVMADENMQEWASSGAVIVETVRAVRDYLGGAAQQITGRGHDASEANGRSAITAFLGWPEHRVKDALSIIEAEEADLLEPEDTADLAIEQATVMRRSVARIPDPVVRRQAIAAVRASVLHADPKQRAGARDIPQMVREVKEQHAPSKPLVAYAVALGLDREIGSFFHTGITLNGTTRTRLEVIEMIASLRDQSELRGTSGPMADQIADSLEEMARQAVRLAGQLRGLTGIDRLAHQMEVLP